MSEMLAKVRAERKRSMESTIVEEPHEILDKNVGRVRVWRMAADMTQYDLTIIDIGSQQYLLTNIGGSWSNRTGRWFVLEPGGNDLLAQTYVAEKFGESGKPLGEFDSFFLTMLIGKALGRPWMAALDGESHHG